MSEKEIGLGRLFVQEAIKAGTWGIIFLIILGMFIISIKQDIKEGIAYGVDRTFSQVVLIGTNPYLIGKAKQLVKKGIEYSMNTAAKEVRLVLDERAIDIKSKEKVEK
ncbi:MAG: hypothetical protein JRC68_04415 [Deltaproteobacteria bacterium]|nr:hypothetical protein [Deltaproteobacteria bacterium]